MKRTTSRRIAAPVAAAAALGLTLSACSASNEDPEGGSDSSLSGELVGAGASSQEAAMAGWSAGFQSANPDVTVNYDPSGSGAGREQFIDGGVDFAGSDAYLEGEELTGAEDRCGQVVEVPAYVSPIAVIYNLPDVDELNLSPEAIAGIFAGTITSWDDDAIAADNPDVELPDLEINPVHRSDESGTSENFTAYLDAVAADVWTDGPVETWPGGLGGEGAQGTSGVVQAVGAGEGSVGYADASQAGDLGTASIGVGDEFVSYSPEAAAAVLEASTVVEGRSDTDIAYDVARDTEESGVYPIVLVSYHLACTEYDDAEKAGLVKAFLEYVLSEEGQQDAAEAAGSAPLSSTVRDQALAAVDAIQTS